MVSRYSRKTVYIHINWSFLLEIWSCFVIAFLLFFFFTLVQHWITNLTLKPGIRSRTDLVFYSVSVCLFSFTCSFLLFGVCPSRHRLDWKYEQFPFGKKSITDFPEVARLQKTIVISKTEQIQHSMTATKGRNKLVTKKQILGQHPI